MDPCDHLIAGVQRSESEDNLHYDQRNQSNGETLQGPEWRLQPLSHHQCGYCEREDCESRDNVGQGRDEAGSASFVLVYPA